VAAAALLFAELGREISSFVSGALKIAITTFNVLKEVVTKVVRFALSPFKKAWDAVTGAIRRVAEIATGILIAGTIRKLGQAIKEAASSALEAGIGFQVMEVRLKGLAARQIYNSGVTENFGEALDLASGKAEELLDWVVKLSLKAPISTEAIADTLTLATSYGLAETEAKKMTTAVLQFASGMGLTDIAQRRIIENFGQMIQQGKITSMELRDMGRGAFVPVNDLLNRTGELLGINTKELGITAQSLNDFAKREGLDPTITILEAFIQMIETEFPGAIERMGATIQGLRQRFQNLVRSMVGLNILKPSLDLLGETIGAIFDAIAGDDQFGEITKDIGLELRGLVQGLIDNLPTIEEMVVSIKGWLTDIKTALKFISEGDWKSALLSLGIPQSTLDFLDKITALKDNETLIAFWENITGGLQNIKDFWEQNKEPIIEAVKVAIGEIADALGIDLPDSPGESFLKWTENLDATDVINKINDIKDAIILFIEKVKELPAKIEKLIPWVIALGKAAFFLKYPLLAIAAGFISGTIKGYGTGGTGVTATNVDVPEHMGARMGGNQQTVNNYNMNMSAYYQNAQSPAAVKDDVSVLLSSIGH